MTTIDFARLGQGISQRYRWVILLILALGAAALVGILAVRQPLLAIAVALLAMGTLIFFVWPDSPTLAVMFVIYTNAAVIGVRFHNMPFVLSVAVPALLVIPLAYYLIFRRQKLIIDPIAVLLFLYLGVQVFGTLNSESTDVALSSLLTFVVEGFGLYLLIINTVRTARLLRQAIWVLLIAGAFLGTLSIIQQITQTYNNNYWGFAQMSNAAFGTGVETLQGEVFQPRLAGPLGDQNYYAQFMLMLVPLGMFRFWGERSKFLRLLAVVTTGLISFGVALTFSRGAMVGFGLMLVVMTLMRYIKIYQIGMIVFAVALLLVAVPQYATRLNSLTALSSVTQSDTAGIAAADASTESRTSEMLAAALVFVEHPLIGVGPGLFKYYYPDYAEALGVQLHTTARAAHNLYLGIAAETGGLGLGCFLAILFITLRGLARARRRFAQSHPELSNLSTGFLIAIVTFLTTGLFLSLAYERYFWLMVALAGAMNLIANQPDPLADSGNKEYKEYTKLAHDSQA